MLGERTATRDIASGFFRGLAAAARGYVGAKVAVAQARNDRDLQKANFALEGARLELIKQKQAFESQHQQRELESKERMHAETMDVARFQIVTDHEGKMYKVDKETGSAVQIATIQGETQRDVAGTQAESAKDVAGAQADAQRDVATIQGETQRDVAGTQADAVTESAQIQADAQRAVAEIQREIAEKGYASKESIAAMEQATKALGLNFGGLGANVQTLNGDEWKRLNDMLTKVSQNKDMTIIRHIKGGFVTAMQGFIDASRGGPLSQQAAVANSEEAQGFGFSMADMAIINGYQRMIDPGATVREGDVDALIASMAKSEQLRAFVNQYIGTGGRFTPEGRAALAEMVLNQYNANVDARSPALASQMQDILRASGLEARGFGMDFFNIPMREQRTIEQILQSGGEWATGIGAEPQTVEPDPKKPQPEGTVGSAEVQGAGDLGQSEGLPLMALAQAYKKNIEQGMSEEQVLEALRAKLAEFNVPEDQMESVIAQIRDRVNATGEGTTIGEMETEIDDAQRIAKVAQPSMLEVADLDNEDIYRNLKIKFAPAGFAEYTEQEWNRYKGQAYQDMLDAGMPEAVAKAMIAKIRAEIAGSGDWAADTDEEG